MTWGGSGCLNGQDGKSLEVTDGYITLFAKFAMLSSFEPLFSVSVEGALSCWSDLYLCVWTD